MLRGDRGDYAGSPCQSLVLITVRPALTTPPTDYFPIRWYRCTAGETDGCTTAHAGLYYRHYPQSWDGTATRKALPSIDAYTRTCSTLDVPASCQHGAHARYLIHTQADTATLMDSIEAGRGDTASLDVGRHVGS